MPATSHWINRTIDNFQFYSNIRQPSDGPRVIDLFILKIFLILNWFFLVIPFAFDKKQDSAVSSIKFAVIQTPSRSRVQLIQQCSRHSKIHCAPWITLTLLVITTLNYVINCIVIDIRFISASSAACAQGSQNANPLTNKYCGQYLSVLNEGMANIAICGNYPN